MKSPMLRPLTLCATALLTACAGVPTRTFQIDAVDVEDQPVACLIVVDGDWTTAIEQNQIVNLDGKDVLPVTVEFHNPIVMLTAAPVPIDRNTGKPSKLPRSRDESKALTDYLCDVRDDLRITDPDRVMFIVRAK